MSTMFIQSGTLDDIADAIRAKTGKSSSMTPLEMPTEIGSITAGVSDVINVFGHDVIVDESITVTQSGTFYATMFQNNVTGSFVLTKNGSTVSRTSGYTTGNTYGNYYAISVQVGDVLRMYSSYAYAGYNSWCIGTGYVEPST